MRKILVPQCVINISQYWPCALRCIGDHRYLQPVNPIHTRLERNPRVAARNVLLAVSALSLANPQSVAVPCWPTLTLGLHERLSIDFDQFLRQDLETPECLPQGR